MILQRNNKISTMFMNLFSSLMFLPPSCFQMNFTRVFPHSPWYIKVHLTFTIWGCPALTWEYYEQRDFLNVREAVFFSKSYHLYFERDKIHGKFFLFSGQAKGKSSTHQINVFNLYILCAQNCKQALLGMWHVLDTRHGPCSFRVSNVTETI